MPWDNPASTEVHFVSEAFRQLSHDEQVSLHGSRHLLMVLLVTRPFTDAEGNEARILPPRAYERPAPDIYAPRKKVADASNLPEFLPEDDADEDAVNSEQGDDDLSADPIVSVNITSQQSSAAGAPSQNFFVNPVTRNIEPAGLHPQYEETVNAETYTPLLHNVELRRAHRASIDAHNEAQSAMYVDPSLSSLSAASTQPYFRLVTALRRVSPIIPLPPMLLAFAALKLAYADGMAITLPTKSAAAPHLSLAGACRQLHGGVYRRRRYQAGHRGYK